MKINRSSATGDVDVGYKIVLMKTCKIAWYRDSTLVSSQKVFLSRKVYSPCTLCVLSLFLAILNAIINHGSILLPYNHHKTSVSS